MLMLILDVLEGVIVKVVSLIPEMTTLGMAMESRKATKLKKAIIIMELYNRGDRKAAGV